MHASSLLRAAATLSTCLFLCCSSGYVTFDGFGGTDLSVAPDGPPADAPIWVAADAGTDGPAQVDVAFRPIEDQTSGGSDTSGGDDPVQGPDGGGGQPDLGSGPDLVGGPDMPDLTGPLSCPGGLNGSCPGTALTFEEGESQTLNDRALAPAGEADTLTLQFHEASHLCFPGEGQSFAASVEIIPAAGSELEVGYNLDGCNDTWSPAGQLAFCFTWGGVCAGNDDVSLHLQLTSTRAATCAPYQMRVTFCNEGESCGGC